MSRIRNCSNRNCSKEEDISSGMLGNRIRKYLTQVEQSLITKNKPGNLMFKYSNKKVLTKEEQFEYENMELKIENDL